MSHTRFLPKRDETDLVLSALASRVRRTILDDLDTHTGISVAYLREEVQLTRQGIRKHLAELMRAGIVVRWYSGREAIYYIDPRPIRRVLAALGRRYRRRAPAAWV